MRPHLALLLPLLPACWDGPSLCYQTSAQDACPQVWSSSSCAPQELSPMWYLGRALSLARSCSPAVARSEVGPYEGLTVVDVRFSGDQRWVGFYSSSGTLRSLYELPGDLCLGGTWYGQVYPAFGGIPGADTHVLCP